MLRKKDIAEKYKVSARTVNEWMKSKKVPYMKIGGSVRFDPDDVDVAIRKFTVRAREY